MPERDGYIAGVPCWVDTNQPDPEAAASFYSDLFGWEIENVMPNESEGKYFIGRLRGGDVAAIGSVPPGGPPIAVWNTYVAVDSADETAKRVTDAGGKVLAGPFDVMDAGRMAICSDPQGAVFSLWQAGRTKGAQIVNEHGSLSFNGLHTRDVDGAREFYGAVFGWSTITLDGALQMWTLPAYGDLLEAANPGLRDGLAEMGATPEFADVVASLNPITEDQGDVPVHWSVTFAVDDADAIAAKTSELGGGVITAPFDAPWVRMAVLTDPQGATFIASQFVAENREVGSSARPAAAA